MKLVVFTTDVLSLFKLLFLLFKKNIYASKVTKTLNSYCLKSRLRLIIKYVFSANVTLVNTFFFSMHLILGLRFCMNYYLDVLWHGGVYGSVCKTCHVVSSS